MTIRQVLRKVGQWSISLKADAPPGVISAIDPFGHIAIIPGRLDPVERGDELLTLARYVGIFRDRDGADGVTLSGVGMEAWLGDEDGKGSVIEAPGVTLTGATFAESIRALLPAGGAITEGTLYSGITGTYSATHVYQTPRAAIDYVCDTMGQDAAWRVNGNGTLDAGPTSSLFRTTPTCVIARRNLGHDLTLRSFPGDLTTTLQSKDYTTRVVLVAQGLASGDADAETVPYKDIHGNNVVWTRVVDEQDTTASANADARAQAVLNLWGSLRKSVRLSVTEFDIAGNFTPGDVVYVHDPDNGLVDASIEVPFRGELLHPAQVQVRSLTWPVTVGYTVAYRSGDGVWTDLTPWVAWESPDGGDVEVSDSLSSTLTTGPSPVPGSGGGPGDIAIPGTPTFGAFSTSTYQSDNGVTLASVVLAWTQPLNTDGSTIVDGDRYEVRYRPTGSTDWQQIVIPFDCLGTTVYGLAPNLSYDWQIRCVDYATPPNYGAWSATTAYTTSADTVAPSTPAAPTVAASLVAVQVTHTLGVATGGTFNLELDLDHLEVHLGASSGFTPDATSLAGKLPANSGMILAGIPAIGTYQTSSTATVYVKVVAVDKTGNRSSASSAASATATLIDSAHISDLTATKITAGTLSAAVILSGSIKTAESGARVEIDSSGVRAYNSGGANTVNIDAATGTATVTGTVQTGLTGQRIIIDPSGTPTIYFYPATGSSYGWLNSLAPGCIEASSTATGSTRTRLQLTPAASALECINTTGDAMYGGHLQVDYLSGTLAAYTSGAVLKGHLDVDTTAATISLYGGAWVQCTADVFVSNNGVDSWLWCESDGTTTMAGSAITLQGDNRVTVLGTASPYSEIWLGDGTSANRVISGSIYNTTSSSAANVYITSAGWLVRSTSSARYKTGIEPHHVDPAAVLRLEPKSWWDNGETERDNTAAPRRHAGLVAEDVAAIPGLDWLVTLDADGEPDAVEYGRIAVALIPVLRELWARVVGDPPPYEGRTSYSPTPPKRPVPAAPRHPPARQIRQEQRPES